MLTKLPYDILLMLFEFSGVASFIHFFFVSKLFQKWINGQNPKFLNKLLLCDVKPVLPIRQHDIWSLVASRRKLTFVDSPMGNWIRKNWYAMYLDQYSKQQIKPLFVTKMQELRLEYQMSPRSLKDAARNVRKMKKPYPDISLYKIEDLSGICKLFNFASIYQQKITMTSTRILLNDIEISVPCAKLELKERLKWKIEENTVREIVLSIDGIFEGYIDSTKSYFSKFDRPIVRKFLYDLNKYPIELCAAVGKFTRQCVFCSKPLDDLTSLEYGYGFRCAKNRNLLWKKPSKRKRINYDSD